MAKHATYLLVLFCFQALFHCGIGQYDRTFDYFKLALQWPLAVCSDAHTRPCQMNPLPEDFTIHGFYPTDEEADQMHDCYYLKYRPIEALFHYGIGQYDLEFDYFKLALQWPLAVCSGKYTPTCQMNPLPEDFTIHGFYPTVEEADPPIHDCYYLEYRPIEWQDLVDRLNRNWPSLVHGPEYNDYHWEKQWIKHGTCSLIFYYQLMYFDLASDLKDSFDILLGLRERGIVPSDFFMYSIQEIRDAVKDFTTKTGDVNCYWSKRNNLLISEIIICFSPGGEIIDCYPYDFARGCNRPFAYFPKTLSM